MEGVYDQVCVEVEDTLLQLLEVAVDFGTRPAGGESRDKDVEFTVVGLILLQVRINHSERVLVAKPNLTDVIERIGDQGKELVHCVHGFGGGPEEILAKLTSKTIQHELGGRFASWVLVDEVWIEGDAFSLFVLTNVLVLGLRGDGPSGVARGLLLDLEPSIEVLGKESLFALWKVLNLVDVDELAPQVEDLLGVWWQRHDLSNRVSPSLLPGRFDRGER